MIKEYKDKRLHEWLHFIRLKEIESVVRHMPNQENLKLLEIGGGDGFLASLLDKMGYSVTSIDLEPRFPQSFPVQKVSDSNLPFNDKQFDIIFSSHVLEHVTDLKRLLSEVNRVSKPEATIVHIMPTPAWRIITSLWILLILPFRFLIIMTGSHKKKSNSSTNKTSESQLHGQSPNGKGKGKIQKLKHMVLHPHGEYPSFIHEIYYFSAFRWKRVLKTNGQICTKVKCGPILYSGVSVFKFKFIRLRKLISWLLFSSGNIYIIEK